MPPDTARVLSAVRGSSEPIYPGRIERIVFPKGRPKENLPEVLIALDHLREIFPGNLATVVTGPKKGFVYWYNQKVVEP